MQHYATRRQLQRAIFCVLAWLYRARAECCVSFLMRKLAWHLASLVSKMPAHLKPTMVRTHRQQQQSKHLEYWQKLIDDHTAEEFERYAAAKTHRQWSSS